jgi:hypothetical protein
LIVVIGAGLKIDKIVGVANSLRGREFVCGVWRDLVNFLEERLGEEELANMGNIATFISRSLLVNLTADVGSDLGWWG